jgi:hypothetical protein
MASLLRASVCFLDLLNVASHFVQRALVLFCSDVAPQKLLLQRLSSTGCSVGALPFPPVAMFGHPVLACLAPSQEGLLLSPAKLTCATCLMYAAVFCYGVV